jgi:hypothetical protein
MGRYRKPTAALQHGGSFDKNPDRGEARAVEVMPTEPLGACPRYLGAAERAIWKELEAKCAPGVLKAGDEFALEQLVYLIADMRKLKGRFGRTMQLLKGLGDFGLTPVGRSYINARALGIPKANEKASGFAQLRGARRPAG